MANQRLYEAPIQEKMFRRDGTMSATWRDWFNKAQIAVDLDSAPSDAGYIVRQTNAQLSAAQSLGNLATGYLKNTTVATVGTLTTTFDGSDWENLNANELVGVIPDASVPDPLPAVSGANLTNLDADALASGTLPNARFPATLPAVSGANLTNLDASDLASGTVPDARFPAYDLSGIVTIDDTDSPYAVTTANGTILADAAAGAITVTLPAVGAWVKRQLTIKKIDASANVVTVDGDGADIDGAATEPLSAQWQAVTVQSNGTDWFIIATV